MIYDIQRAGLLKRISAWLLDAILLLVLATGAMAGMAYLLDLDAHSQELTAIYDRYEKEYNVPIRYTEDELIQFTENELAKLTEEELTKLTAEDLAKLTEEGKDKLIQEEKDKIVEEKLEAYRAANEALGKDTHAWAVYEQFVNASLLTVSIGVLAAYLILELIVPLLLKNGQTLGKKAFGLALVRKDCVRVTPFMLFARTVLGKYTVETMVPVLLVMLLIFGLFGSIGTSILMIFLVIHVILPMITKNHSAIHDYMACTVVVDFNSQMIFASADELLEYKKKIQAEAANKADY